MKNYILLFFIIFFFTTISSQEKAVVFKSGEWLKYKMNYSGFLRAGTAILEVEEKDFTDLIIGFIQYLPNLFNIIIHDFSGTYDKKRLAPFLSEKDIKIMFKSDTESSSEEK